MLVQIDKQCFISLIRLVVLAGYVISEKAGGPRGSSELPRPSPFCSPFLWENPCCVPAEEAGHSLDVPSFS